MRRPALLGASLLATLAITACQDQVTQPTAPSARDRATANLQAAAPQSGPDRSRLTLPAFGAVADLPSFDRAPRAINPSDYACPPDSPITTWLNAAIDRSLSVERMRFLTAYNYLADVLPTYEALYFQTSATPQSFGVDGRHTKTIVKAERDLKRFWDIPSSDIQVVAMHGSMLIDTLRTARTYQLLGYSPAAAANFARTLRNAIVGSQTMVNGNHPLFTFNAFALTTFGGPIPDKIVMGDGILAGYDALGFGDVAPQAIFAHEFAHHVQFEKGYELDAPAAEATRFGELSADAMAAYYLTHSRGATMNRKRVEQFLQVFYQIGDCAFTSDGHHGTPNQRLAAAQFGFALADRAQKQGHIMSPDEVHAEFLKVFPTLIAPDAR
ncbi:MAG: hypothetical protein ACXWZS_11575 [Gemmatirosa sp.]